MTEFYFVEPTDSMFFRSNLPFGGAGEHGVGLMPPPPSVFAGAFRSAILAQEASILTRFLREGTTGDGRLRSVIGEADPASGAAKKNGTFRISSVTLAGSRRDATASVPERVYPLPADLVPLQSGFARLMPRDRDQLLIDGRELPLTAVLCTHKQEKAKSGLFLRESGWRKYLDGALPAVSPDTIDARHLYARDPRLGIGLDANARTAMSGLIYTTEGFAFGTMQGYVRSQQELSTFAATGFLVGIDGADGTLPESGFLRLGGDGRAAHYRRVNYKPPEPFLDSVARERRFRLVLTTAGLFSLNGGRHNPEGWIPDGVKPEGNDFVLRTKDFSARLVCAAASRREIVSGWDLFRWKPKDAHASVPAGAVYWFEALQGDSRKLYEWVRGGLWGHQADPARRTEGFNNAIIAAWPHDDQ